MNGGKQMKTSLSVTALLILFVTCAPADQFQFRQVKEQQQFDASYSTVTVRRANEVVFTGKTDRFGRVTVSLPKGQYQAEVSCPRQTAKVSLTIDGAKNLKSVTLK
jgi:hypothetical protein